jgi:NAD(P)-dependent dehydrogenase (short-subunit alcohol dehydrogenase family)
MPGRLRNKVAIITGGGSGYGAGIATTFAQEGAKVVIADLSVENGEKVASELGCAFVNADITKRADWEAVLEEALAVYGGVDIVVNNAGACYPNKVGTYSFLLPLSSEKEG